MKKDIEKLLKKALYEQDEEELEKPAKKDPVDDDDDDEEELEKKDISNIEKGDLEDEEERDSLDDEEEPVLSVNINKMPDKGGQIKLVKWGGLESFGSIESILKLFNLDSEKLQQGFEDRIIITIKSPLQDFKEEEYKITLMDKIGEISINRPDFVDTITKKSTGQGMNMQQAIGAEETGEVEEKPAEEIDLSYLPELNTVFLKTIKGQFFDRILEKRS